MAVTSANMEQIHPARMLTRLGSRATFARNSRIPHFVAATHNVSARRNGPSRIASAEAMVSKAPTIDAKTSTKIANAVTTRTTSENNVEVSLPASVVNQANPKPASNEVRVVS